MCGESCRLKVRGKRGEYVYQYEYRYGECMPTRSRGTDALQWSHAIWNMVLDLTEKKRNCVTETAHEWLSTWPWAPTNNQKRRTLAQKKQRSQRDQVGGLFWLRVRYEIASEHTHARMQQNLKTLHVHRRCAHNSDTTSTLRYPRMYECATHSHTHTNSKLISARGVCLGVCVYACSRVVVCMWRAWHICLCDRQPQRIPPVADRAEY